MVLLVIILSCTLTVVGKTRGQLTTVPGAINVRIISPVPLDPRTFIVPEQSPQLPRSFPRQYSVQITTDRFEPSERPNRGDLNLRSPTLETRPNRRLFVPERSPERNRPNKTRSDPITSNTEKFDPPVKIQPDMDLKPSNEGNESRLVKPNSTTIAPSTTSVTNKPKDPGVLSKNEFSNDRSRVNGSTETDGTTGKPTVPTVVDKATGVEITLDERASFEGDKCPTGYVRINGKCVEKD